MINQAYQEAQISQYAQALFEVQEKKTCTKIANKLNQAHDQVIRFLDKTSRSLDRERGQLALLAKKELNADEIYFLGDDSTMAKIFGSKFEGLEQVFDGSTKRVVMGMKIVAAMLTDGIKKIPIDVANYVGKILGSSTYKSKSEILLEMFAWVGQKIAIARLIADAHYVEANFLQKIIDLSSNFLLKITRSRIVTIGEKTGQLRNLLRLQKNEHSRSASGSFQGIACYFHVVKIAKKITVYFITNDPISALEACRLYKIRWNIETLFEVGKQHFGMAQCQARSSEKQLAHIFQCMHAFAFADLTRFRHDLPNIQSAIRLIRSQNRIKHVLDLSNGREVYAFA